MTPCKPRCIGRFRYVNSSSTINILVLNLKIWGSENAPKYRKNPKTEFYNKIFVLFVFSSFSESIL